MTKLRRGNNSALSRIVQVGALLAAISVVFAAQALASEPTGNYKVFKDCPYESTAVKQCNYSETTSGEVVVGSSRVQITHPLILQGGSSLNFETEQEEFFAAKDGNTLVKVPEPVEGGLVNLIPKKSLPEWLWPAYEAVFENGVSGVNATTELAKPASQIGISASNLAAGEGVALTLPVRVHLENPFLGSDCYIGSSSAPVYLNLTTGTTSPPGPNKSITGFPGNFEFLEEGRILVDTGYKLVDNAFSAPSATGCGGLFSFIVNPILNGKVGLPSAAGKNTAVLNGILKRGARQAVLNSVK